MSRVALHGRALYELSSFASQQLIEFVMPRFVRDLTKMVTLIQCSVPISVIFTCFGIL
jgi:hypothetical protein